jgi:lysylphosphatidylglycerol synthetase-like protein (DUF2156 family)
VPEFCTCGAQLPPDARFCHRCGRPLFESPVPETDEQPVVEIPRVALPPRPPEISFHNGLAVRIALIVSILALLVSALSGPLVFLPILWMLAAGFTSVYLYRRRTGQRLSTLSGARMGWITGLFAFVLVMILFTVIVVALSDPEVASALTAQLQARGAAVDPQQAIHAFRSPAGIAQGLLGFFVVCGLLPTLGGALGAKLLGGDAR